MHWPRRKIYLCSANEVESSNYDVLATIEREQEGKRLVYGLEYEEDMNIGRIEELR